MIVQIQYGVIQDQDFKMDGTLFQNLLTNPRVKSIIDHQQDFGPNHIMKNKIYFRVDVGYAKKYSNVMITIIRPHNFGVYRSFNTSHPYPKRFLE